MNYFISMLSTTVEIKNSPREILINYNKIKKINSRINTVIGFGITEKL